MNRLNSLLAILPLITLASCDYSDLGLDNNAYGTREPYPPYRYDNRGYNDRYYQDRPVRETRPPVYRPYNENPNQYNGDRYRDGKHDDVDNARDDGVYYGGANAWYRSGFNVGKSDIRKGQAPDYRRHSNQYDKVTEDQFRRGYNDAYRRR